MATLTVRAAAIANAQPQAQTLTDQRAIAQRLAEIGVRFETWGVDRLPAELRSRNLTDAEKQQVLTAFAPELDELKSQGGYVAADVVTLYPDTPNLEVMLGKFDKKHLHVEDEVRFCVQGSGVFTLYPDQGGALDVHLQPGDFISVPAKYHHLFTLTDERRITAIRLFVDPAGWIAHYVA